ncbi:MAG: tetracycline resistance MFS efflux pump [Deltaproteobacteria bacterium]|nr:tetracycline resistance MFS efflux pump [Deltaproteobacteria bacterium]
MRSERPSHAIRFILITILIDTLGFGMIAPVMPKLITQLTGEGFAAAARYGGLLMLLFAGIQFIAAPILGNLGDRFGRRPVLLISLAALGLDYVVIALAPTIAWLFVGRFVSAVASATFATANAWVADVSPPEDRARHFGFLSAAWGLGFMLGPVIGGLLGEYGSRVPFWAAAGLALLNVVYGFFVLPESLPEHSRRPFELSRANPIGALLQVRNHPVVLGLFVVLVPYQIAQDVNPAVWGYYTMHKFGWSVSDVGWSLFVVGGTVMIVNALLVAPAIQKLGEKGAVYLGFGAMSASFVIFAFATQSWMMYAGITSFALLGVAQPALRGMMANRVPPEAQGELQGALASLMSLTMIVSPVFHTELFHTFSRDGAAVDFPGAPFLAAAFLALLATLLFARATRRESATI